MARNSYQVTLHVKPKYATYDEYELVLNLGVYATVKACEKAITDFDNKYMQSIKNMEVTAHIQAFDKRTMSYDSGELIVVSA